MTKSELIQLITEQGQIARSAILHMTSLAKSGHPGGSMSSIDVILSIYGTMKHDPKNPNWEKRDYFVSSIGHISPAIYSALAINGYFPLDEAVAYFRKYGSIYEGHIEREVPGVEWTTGNLGQGLSAAVGFALASRIKKMDKHIFVMMGDGEQQKGQISEARRFANKYKLNNLTVFIDYNQLQISGSIHDVMPQSLRRGWEADGWQVLEINGHDISQILTAIEESRASDKPTMILAKTVMGKGVSFMENDPKFHGAALNEEQLAEAIKELGMENKLLLYKEMRAAFEPKMSKGRDLRIEGYALEKGEPIVYESAGDCRGAWGKALVDLAKANEGRDTLIVGVDCDLAGSVKLDGFAKEFPEQFFQSGIMEHHAAVMSGALSTMGMQCFWAGFGVFGIDETYNMQRLNDINQTNLKTVLTHVGIDVGEDGKTHHSIDYIALVRNLFGTRIICPSDANQTDRIVRWLIDKPGNYVLAMGRSKLPIIKKEDGTPYYDENYNYEYAVADVLRKGDKATIFATGTVVNQALGASDELKEQGIDLQVVAVASPLEIEDELVKEAAKKGTIFIVEDHSINGGLGATIKGALVRLKLMAKVVHHGISGYCVSGASSELYKAYALDKEGLVKSILSELR